MHMRPALTPQTACLSVAPVIRHLRTFAALLMLALWLPATQHCGLEAAGLFGPAVECHNDADCASPHEQSHCDADNCQPIENSAYKSSLNLLQIAAPEAFTCLFCLHVISPETIVLALVSPERTDAPPELAPSWRFLARAVASPRAPSLAA